MHRCHVPSGWRGPSHLLMTGPPYRQPALAGGATAISAADIRRAADAPTVQRLMLASPEPQPAINDGTAQKNGGSRLSSIRAPALLISVDGRAVRDDRGGLDPAAEGLTQGSAGSVPAGVPSRVMIASQTASSSKPTARSMSAVSSDGSLIIPSTMCSLPM
jgi:hypothetical protein